MTGQRHRLRVVDQIVELVDEPKDLKRGSVIRFHSPSLTFA
jgi:hypothetical protein